MTGRPKCLQRWLGVVLGAAATSCAERVQGPCTPDRRLGLGIVVANDQTGAHVCDATVTARDGAYSETLRPTSWSLVSPCLYVGASERSGTYSVHAEAARLSPGMLSSVTVPITEDGCHVRMVQREIRLRPTGQP